VGGPLTLATAVLYLVLKSNGLRHSKNPPVRFSFSLKIVPATIAKKLPLQLRPKPLFIAFFSLSHKRPTFAFTPENEYTLGFTQKIAHKGTHGETGGRFGLGAITTLGTFRTFTNIPGPGIRTAYFAALGSWPGGALEEHRKPVEQRCAYARRCSEASRPRWAALLCLQFGDVAVFSLCAQGFPHMQKREWYHYPRRAPRVVETPDGRLSKRLICRFLRSGGRSSPHDSYFLANTQNFLLAVPVANAFALWYDKFSKLEID